MRIKYGYIMFYNIINSYEYISLKQIYIKYLLYENKNIWRKE